MYNAFFDADVAASFTVEMNANIFDGFIRQFNDEISEVPRAVLDFDRIIEDYIY